MKKFIKISMCILMTCMMLISATAISVSAVETTYPIEKNADSPLKGIKVGFYGDSICYASCERSTGDYTEIPGWAGRIGYANEMNWKNFGVSGSSVSRCREDRQGTILQQIKSSISRKNDMFILHGGTNDAWDSAPVGTMSADFRASTEYSNATFAGGLEQTFAYLREKYPNATIGYIINFKFINANKGLLDEMAPYVEMTKNICDKWEIPYLDLYSNDLLTATLHPSDGKGGYLPTYFSNGDFVHPNTEGYDIITPYIEAFMIDLVTAPDETTATTVIDAPAIETTTEDVTTTEADVNVNVEVSCKGFAASTAVVAFAAVSCTAICARKRKED